jgi:hypothetical protein
MSLNDVFGEFPGRPDHPDFALLVDVVLQQDGKTEDKGFDIEEYMAPMIDPPSLTHMAQQRALRTVAMMGRDPRNNPKLVNVIASMYFDGFFTGYHFREKRSESEAPDA